MIDFMRKSVSKLIEKDWETLKEKLKIIVKTATSTEITDEQITLNNCGNPHKIKFPL